MTEIFHTLQPKNSMFWAGYGLLSSKILRALRLIDRNIARHREEAMLRTLDRRLLQEIGFEPASTVESKPDHASGSDSARLRELFSWTRFAK
jgi:hypothetical protein